MNGSSHKCQSSMQRYSPPTPEERRDRKPRKSALKKTRTYWSKGSRSSHQERQGSVKSCENGSTKGGAHEAMDQDSYKVVIPLGKSQVSDDGPGKDWLPKLDQLAQMGKYFAQKEPQLFERCSAYDGNRERLRRHEEETMRSLGQSLDPELLNHVSYLLALLLPQGPNDIPQEVTHHCKRNDLVRKVTDHLKDLISLISGGLKDVSPQSTEAEKPPAACRSSVLNCHLLGDGHGGCFGRGVTSPDSVGASPTPFDDLLNSGRTVDPKRFFEASSRMSPANAGYRGQEQVTEFTSKFVTSVSNGPSEKTNP